jgi:ADP-dependent NAD(P)H-hydrate dehydratase / NAD(P)H-hydrate epimerase
MGRVTTSEAIALEKRVIAAGLSEETLLELAGTALGHSIGRFFTASGTAIGYLGKGHNAADTLIALGILRDHYGWDIAIRPAFPISSCAPLTQRVWTALGAKTISAPESLSTCPARPLLLLDGLLGLGAAGPLRPPLRQWVDEMNSLRHRAGARIAAIDVPTGIDPDTGLGAEDAVHADITFMIANAKSGLLQAHAAAATGALAIVPVSALTAPLSRLQELISPQTLSHGKAPRPFDFHKGQAGRVGLLVGSERYVGAAVLAATGALRGGAGLVTLLVPPTIQTLVQSACPPEIIVRVLEDPLKILLHPFDALVLGCGLDPIDPTAENALLALIQQTRVPTVIDAALLNLVARRDALASLTDQHILTPHPGEFARLVPDLAALPREIAIRRFAAQIPSTVLLKGSRTLVTLRGEPLWCNSTGCPAMATGGQGDLLAGVIAAILASGQPHIQAACLGAWICGRSAEIALQQHHLSEESLTPSDVAHFLGAAFNDWRCALR